MATLQVVDNKVIDNHIINRLSGSLFLRDAGKQP